MQDPPRASTLPDHEPEGWVRRQANGDRGEAVMPELRLGRAIYHGGFSFIPRTGLVGGLVLDDDAVTMVGVPNEKRTREITMELCRTRAIAAMEITSEQVARRPFGGLVGALSKKQSMDRATLIVFAKERRIGVLHDQRSIRRLPPAWGS